MQQKLGREVPYLHCFNHRLHVVVVDRISSISRLTNYFDYRKTLYNFFRQPKVQSLYSGTHFHRLMEQMWTGHLKTTLSVVNNYMVKSIGCSIRLLMTMPFRMETSW